MGGSGNGAQTRQAVYSALAGNGCFWPGTAPPAVSRCTARIELKKHVDGLIDSAQAMDLSESDIIALIQQTISERKQQ